MEPDEIEMSEEEIQKWIRDQVMTVEVSSDVSERCNLLQSQLERRQEQITTLVNLCQSVTACEESVKEVYALLGWEYRDSDSDDSDAQPTDCRHTMPFLSVSSESHNPEPSSSRAPIPQLPKSKDKENRERRYGHKSPVVMKKAVVVLTKLSRSEITAALHHRQPSSPEIDRSENEVSSNSGSDMQWEPENGCSDSDFSVSDFDTGSNKRIKMCPNNRKYEKSNRSSQRRRNFAVKVSRMKSSTATKSQTNVSKGTPQPNDSVRTPKSSSSKTTPQTNASKRTPQTNSSETTPQINDSVRTPKSSSSKRPDTNASKTTSQTNASKRTPEINSSKTTPQTNTSKTTPQTNSSETTPQINDSVRTLKSSSSKRPDTNSSKTTPQTNVSKTTSQTNGSKTTPQTNSSETTPQTNVSKTTSQTNGSVRTLEINSSKTTPQTNTSEAAPQTNGSKRNGTTNSTTPHGNPKANPESNAAKTSTPSKNIKEVTSVSHRPATTAPQSVPQVEITVNMNVLARRKSLSWQKGKIIGILKKEDGKVKYKIAFERKGKSLVSSHHIALDCPPKLNMLFVGARVVVRDEDDQLEFKPGVMAEMPSRKNRMRFMVFIDDHTPVYVGLPSLRLVCKPLPDPLDDIPDDNHRLYMKEYLNFWPYPPLTQYMVGHKLNAEYNGVQQKCEVLATDGSLIQVVFLNDQHKEWLYRGSSRMEHLIKLKEHMLKKREESSVKAH